MKRSNKKKGFTLVELIVVIAILAILATVSIVGYVSFITKSKQSADEQAVTQMNTYLEAEEVLSGKPKDVGEVIEILITNGIAENVDTYYNKYQLGWDSVANRIVLIENNVTVYPDKLKGQSVTAEGTIKPLVKAYITTFEALKEALNDTNVDTLVLGGNLVLDEKLVIDRPKITIVGFGNALVSSQSVWISNSCKDLVLKNVTFESPKNERNNASNVYLSDFSGKAIIENCTFKNTQWDSIQITPVDGAEITIRNCNFYNEAGYEAERYVHIQAVSGANCNAKVTVVNNKFGSTDFVRNSIIDIDYIDYKNNLTVFGNTIEKVDIGAGDVYICDTNGGTWAYQEAYDAFTASK